MGALNLLFGALKPEDDEDKYQETTGSQIASGIGDTLNGGPLLEGLFGGSIAGNLMGMLGNHLRKKTESEG